MGQEKLNNLLYMELFALLILKKITFFYMSSDQKIQIDIIRATLPQARRQQAACWCPGLNLLKAENWAQYPLPV